MFSSFVPSLGSVFLAFFFLSRLSGNSIIANCAISDGSDISLGHISFSWWASSPHPYRVATPPVLKRVSDLYSHYSSRSLFVNSQPVPRVVKTTRNQPNSCSETKQRHNTPYRFKNNFEWMPVPFITLNDTYRQLYYLDRAQVLELLSPHQQIFFAYSTRK
jgi:hypothetical protein